MEFCPKMGPSTGLDDLFCKTVLYITWIPFLFTTSAKNSAWPDHKPTPPSRRPLIISKISRLMIRVYTVYHLLSFCFFSVPMAKLDGPFTWHIYIGGSLLDAPKLAELGRRLEKEKISCYLKYSPVYKDAAIISMVNTGITQSQKCLLYISKNYLEDGYYKIETQKVIAKASRFSKDMVILLVDEEFDRCLADWAAFWDGRLWEIQGHWCQTGWWTAH